MFWDYSKSKAHKKKSINYIIVLNSINIHNNSQWYASFYLMFLLMLILIFYDFQCWQSDFEPNLIIKVPSPTVKTLYVAAF